MNTKDRTRSSDIISPSKPHKVAKTRPFHYHAIFRREIIVPSIVQSMSNERIERLDVTATRDRVRLRELCKEDEENNSRSLFGSRIVGSPLTNRTGDVP